MLRASTKRVNGSHMRSLPASNTRAAPTAPGMAHCLQFFLCLCRLALLATLVHRSLSVSTKGTQPAAQPQPIHRCVTCQAEEWSSTSPAPKERAPLHPGHAPNPTCLAVSRVLQPSRSPMSAAATSNATKSSQTNCLASSPSLAGDPEEWEGSPYSRTLASTCT